MTDQEYIEVDESCIEECVEIDENDFLDDDPTPAYVSGTMMLKQRFELMHSLDQVRFMNYIQARTQSAVVDLTDVLAHFNGLERIAQKQILDILDNFSLRCGYFNV